MSQYKPLRISAQNITGALTALAVNSISKVSLNTPLTLGALSVEETLETLPSVGVTVAFC